MRFAKSGRIIILAMVVFLLPFFSAHAETRAPRQPAKNDKCPVCGMFVYKYPDWVAQIVFKDGAVVFFDGAKDLFKYYFNLKKYGPDRSLEDIAAVYVSEYYEIKPIQAAEAYFVVGSDVYGPMGHELIPLATETDAETFKKDHGGKSILRFKEITLQVIDTLD